MRRPGVGGYALFYTLKPLTLSFTTPATLESGVAATATAAECRKVVMRRQGFHLATALMTLALLQHAEAVPPSTTPPVEETCHDGEIAPRLCTLAAAAMTAGWASVRDFLVLTPKSSDYEPYCYSGGSGTTEKYVGRLRGPHGVAEVILVNYICPGEHPRIAAYAAPPDKSWVILVRIEESRRDSLLGVPLPTPTQTLIAFGEGIPWRHESVAYGPVHFDEAEVTASPTGQTEHCDRYSKYNECEEGYRSWEYSVQLQGTVAGRLAELSLDVLSPADGDRSATVRSESYRETGWKITRTS